MIKKFFFIGLLAQFIVYLIAVPIVSAQTGEGAGRQDLNRANLCAAFGEKLGQIGEKVESKRGEFLANREERRTRLEEAWGEFLAKRSERRERVEANLGEHFTKLEERAQTEAQKQAVAAFKVAIQSAIETRRAAIDAAVQAFHEGGESAFESRRAAIEKAINDRSTALKDAIEKAKSDCVAGTDIKTVRATLSEAVKAAQNNFKSAREAEQALKSEIEKLKSDKKTAVEKAVNDFKAAVEKARVELKAAFDKAEVESE